MSNSALDKIGRSSAASTTDRLSQATVVEQSRAVAEVQAAVVVAQQCPRNLDESVRQMRESCAQQALADRAFYRYRRGTGTVTGPSVHLARELARCFGNLQYGISELRRDDVAGESEMLAFAWDVQTNTRSSRSFIVPHGRDTKQGRQVLSDLRDITENNTNQASRAVREAIFTVLPTWFSEEAQTLCHRALSGDSSGKPLSQMVADMVGGFEGIGITKGQLEEKIGRPSRDWIEQDVAQMRVVYTSIGRGEVTKDEEFPRERVTSDEITNKAKPAEDRSEPTLAAPQRKKMFASLGDLGITERDGQLDFIEQAIGRRPEHRDGLHPDEASLVIDAAEAALAEPFPTEAEQAES